MKSILSIGQQIAGGKTMKKITCIDLSKALLPIAVVLVLLLSQTPAQGATNCLMATGVPDFDCDGFSDTEETSPTTPDLFVILEPLTTNSLMPADVLSTLTSAASSKGLTVRRLTSPLAGTRRNVTSTQKAVRIVENSYVGSYLGYSSQGTPNSTPDDSTSTVYTSKIRIAVTGACSNSRGVLLSFCRDANDVNAANLQGVINKFIRLTTAHEAAHQMNLKYTCDSSIGCHYPTITSASQPPTIMDETVFYVRGTRGTTWYLGSQFNSADTNYQLR